MTTQYVYETPFSFLVEWYLSSIEIVVFRSPD